MDEIIQQRPPKPSGWKGKRGDDWYTKDSAYGVLYMCGVCLRPTKRAGFHGHYPSCPVGQEIELMMLKRQLETWKRKLQDDLDKLAALPAMIAEDRNKIAEIEARISPADRTAEAEGGE